MNFIRVNTAFFNKKLLKDIPDVINDKLNLLNIEILTMVIGSYRSHWV